jgi:hypothetical protein
MLHHTFDKDNATLVTQIEAQILEGLTGCKSVSEIAAEIAGRFAQGASIDPSVDSTPS